MTIDELRELFYELESKGMRPRLCDTEVPYYDTPINCGEPLMAHDDGPEETIMLPRELLSMHPEFTIVVRGNSMKDAGIAEGDIVKVVCNLLVEDGDIVLASIDGNHTIKSFYRDDDGQAWLVPQNDDYDAIPLEGKTNVRIIGCIKEVIKRAPRVSYRECRRIVSKTRQGMSEKKAISQQQVSAAILYVAPMVTVGRHWYAVFRKLVDKEAYGAKDYDGFCQRVAREVPDHKHLPTSVEMERMAVQSFAKPVALWNPDNAPVRGKRFKAYLLIAEKTEEGIGRE